MDSVKQETTGSIPREKLAVMFEKMLEIRYFEEASIKAYQQKKIAGFLHTYIGQEAVGVGALDHKLPQDAVVTSYRCHGLYLALGGSPREGMAELFGKVTGCARGKGGSMHFFSKPHNFLGGHGIQRVFSGFQPAPKRLEQSVVPMSHHVHAKPSGFTQHLQGRTSRLYGHGNEQRLKGGLLNPGAQEAVTLFPVPGRDDE
jgi:hypothetical protein